LRYSTVHVVISCVSAIALNVTRSKPESKCHRVIAPMLFRHFTIVQQSPTLCLVGIARRQRPRTRENCHAMHAQKKLVIALACYGVAMVALACGIWIAGSPTWESQKRGAVVAEVPAVIPADCTQGGACLVRAGLIPVAPADGF
jgi:hypothetical protein